MWQGLLNGLGEALSFFYDLIPSYGFAIVLLTVSVRVILLPLTIKQTRSMQAMGKLQPQIKALQRKHKGDRQKLNEEMMKLYKEHRVNPLGGCLPLLLQLPVFFALFSVLRATTPAIALPAEPVSMSDLRGDNVFCTPVGQPSPQGAAPGEIECDNDGDGRFESTIPVGEWTDAEGAATGTPRDIFTRCQPEETEGGEVRFRCESPVGTGHIPSDQALFERIIDDGEPFLGMYLSCGATQAQSEEGIRVCAPRGATAGGAPLVGYYGLIGLMVASTWYQTRQMQSMQGQQQGAQMIGRIMPVFLGFISLSIPAGVLVYWVTTNIWQIGQQYVMLKRKEAAEEQARPGPARKERGPESPGDGSPSAKGGESRQKPPSQRHGGRNARSRKKRRKR